MTRARYGEDYSAELLQPDVEILDWGNKNNIWRKGVKIKALACFDLWPAEFIVILTHNRQVEGLQNCECSYQQGALRRSPQGESRLEPVIIHSFRRPPFHFARAEPRRTIQSALFIFLMLLPQVCTIALLGPPLNQALTSLHLSIKISVLLMCYFLAE